MALSYTQNHYAHRKRIGVGRAVKPKAPPARIVQKLDLDDWQKVKGFDLFAQLPLQNVQLLAQYQDF